MARAVLTPSRQLVVGAATMAAALATVAAGVWMAAAGNPTLDRRDGRPAFDAGPAAVVDAAADGARRLPVPNAVGDMLAPRTSSATTAAAPAAPAPPGGGPAAQPPALPPPPSPPPGAEPEDPVEELVGTVQDVVDDVGSVPDDADETVGDLDPTGDVPTDAPAALSTLP